MLPACNGAMMRNIYHAQAQAQVNTRNYQYSGTNSLNTMSAAAAAAAAASTRYPPMAATSAYSPMAGQPFGMATTMSNMNRQDVDNESDWYNKGFSALRMNTATHNHHANLSTPMLQYQT